MDRAVDGDCQQLRVLARRAEVRVPRRDRAARRDAGLVPQEAGLRGRAPPLSERAGREAPGPDRGGAGHHRHPALRGLFPHRGRHRRLGAVAGHPLPGPRQRGQFHRLLLSRRHRGRPRPLQPALRPLHQRRAPGSARHRHRFRASAARRGHPVHLPKVRPAPGCAGRGGHQLPAALGPARCRPRVGHRPAAHRGGLEEPALVRWPRHRRRAAARERLRSRGAGGPPVDGAHRPAHRLPAPPLAAPGRLRHRQGPHRGAGAGGERDHGRSQRHPVGQGRSGIARPAQGRHPRHRHVERHPPLARLRRCQARPGAATDAGDRRGRHRHLRHDLQGRYGGRVPDREPGPDEHAAPPEAALLLRPGGRGGHRAAGADPGRHGPPLPEEPHPADEQRSIARPSCCRPSSGPRACRSSRSR